MKQKKILASSGVDIFQTWDTMTKANKRIITQYMSQLLVHFY